MARAFIDGNYYESHELFAAHSESNSPLVDAAILCNKAAAQYGLETFRGCIADCEKAISLHNYCLRAYYLKGFALLRSKGLQAAKRAWQEGLSVVLGNSSPAPVHKKTANSITPSEEQAEKAKFDVDVLLVAELSSLVNHPNPPSLNLDALIPMQKVEPPKIPVQKVESPQENAVQIPQELQPLEKKYEPDTRAKNALEAFAQQTVAAVGLSPELLELGRKALTWKTGEVEIDNLITVGNLQVNSGRHREAIEIFNRILAVYPHLVGGYVGLGSAMALIGDFSGATRAFSKAIEVEPMEADAWKRRGQTFASMGKLKEAFLDLTRAGSLSPEKDLDIFNQRAVVCTRLKKYKEASEDFKKILSVQSQNKAVLNQLGLMQKYLGNLDESIRCFEMVIEIDANNMEAYSNRAMLFQERGIGFEALKKYKQMRQLGPHNLSSLNMHSECLYGMGELQKALEIAQFALRTDSRNMNCLKMVALCSQSLGRYNEAAECYEKIQKFFDIDYFYNREMTFWLWSLLDRPFNDYNTDIVIDAEFKHAWIKKFNSLTALPNYERKKPPSDVQPVFPCIDISATMLSLRTAAEKLGENLQLQCQGFLPNRRQYLMGGLSMIEMSQKLIQHWRLLRSGEKGLMIPNTRSSLGANHFEGTHHVMNWRDFYDIGVKWRQLSEPNDSVWWIDKMPLSAFEEGFGLQTPMVQGQLQVIRYSCYYQLAFAEMKRLMTVQCNLRRDVLTRLDRMDDLTKLYNLIGQDFFTVTPVPSTAVPGRVLEGTRLTIRAEELEGYEFLIRTPGTPPRYSLYDVEMTYWWDELNKAACEVEENVCTERILDIAIAFFYYFVNFAPLSRGSAVCGYLSMFSILQATGFEVVDPMKKGVQWDWEAILLPSREAFSELIKPWLTSNSPTKMNSEGIFQLNPSSEIRKENFNIQLPDVESFCPNLRSALQMLNSASSRVD